MEGILAETAKWVKLKCSILSERKHLNLKKRFKNYVLYDLERTNQKEKKESNGEHETWF